eukprot:COSAG06_NODE_2294_length_7143_cov_5.506388_7_plen_162_part_00
MIILPRQAWDKHRITQKSAVSCRLRRDGFVSLDSAGPGAEMLTRYFLVDHRATRLVINADTLPDPQLAALGNGSIAVEVQGEDGTPLPGFTLAQSVPMSAVDDLAFEMAWEDTSAARPLSAGAAAAAAAVGRSVLTQLRGATVRLRFVMARSKLFSFQLRA